MKFSSCLLLLPLAVAMASTVPTEIPSEVPSLTPTDHPTEPPSTSPSVISTEVPSETPTQEPSNPPSHSPSLPPSLTPTVVPSSVTPSEHPTAIPTTPTSHPTSNSLRPSSSPSSHPTNGPSGAPSDQPSVLPSSLPSSQPSSQPSTPSSQPSSSPTEQPSTQPSAAPSNPTSQPSSSPSGQPSVVPTASPSAPTFAPTNVILGAGQPEQINKYWMFADVQGTPHIVIFTFGGVLAIISTASMALKDRHLARKIRVTTGILGLLSVALLDFIILCGRFHFLTNHYYPPDETPAGEFFYPGPRYYHSSQDTLEANHCTVSSHYTDNNGTESLSYYHHSATSKACKLFYTINADIIDGAAILSLFVGLCIYGYLKYFVVRMEVALMKAEEQAKAVAETEANEAAVEANGGEPLSLQQAVRAKVTAGWLELTTHPCRVAETIFNGLLSKFTKYFATLALMSQQSLVLFPLNLVNANDYCLVMNVPTTVHTAVCQYKYAVWAIPMLLIHIPFGLLCGSAVYGAAAAGPLGILLAVLAAMGAFYCIIVVLVYGVYYLFAGVLLGIWYEFSQFHFTQRLVVPEFMSLGLFLYNDILNALSASFNNVPTGGYETPGSTSGRTSGDFEMPEM